MGFVNTGASGPTATRISLAVGPFRSGASAVSTAGTPSARAVAQSQAARRMAMRAAAGFVGRSPCRSRRRHRQWCRQWCRRAAGNLDELRGPAGRPAADCSAKLGA